MHPESCLNSKMNASGILDAVGHQSEFSLASGCFQASGAFRVQTAAKAVLQEGRGVTAEDLSLEEIA